MSGLPFNVFDLLFVAVLVAGLVVGRKHGASEEVFQVLKWVAIVIFCAAAYGPIARLFFDADLFDPYVSSLVAYLGCAMIIFLAFSLLQRRLNSRIRGTDTFGRTEYYLGMGSGCLRFGCVMLVGLALLNARAFSPAEVEAKTQYQEQNFGSALFPTLHQIQEAVFERSLTGSFIRDYLGFLLISPAGRETFAPSEVGARVANR